MAASVDAVGDPVPRSSCISLAIAALMALPAHAADGQCLDAGLAEARSGRWSAAIDAFRAAMAREACAGERATLLFNIASATQNQAEATADPSLACAAVRRYQAYLDAEGDPSLVAERLTAMKTRCAARPIRVEAPPPTPVAAWALTGSAAASAVAGLALYGLALDAVDDRDAAALRYRLAADPGARATAAADFDAADRAAVRRGYASYALLGLGAALAVGATWAWLDDGPALAPTPGGIAVSGRF